MCFLGGAFSHALTKAPTLRGPARKVDALYVDEQIAPTQPTAQQRAVAERAVAAVPATSDGLLYARVDLVDDDAGRPVVLECELVEPSLWLADDAGAAARFAAAIVDWIERAASG